MDLFTALVNEHNWPAGARRLRVRRDDLSVGMIRQAIVEAAAGVPLPHYDGRSGPLPAGVGWSAAIGGTVANSYGYPAETECSAVIAVRTWPRTINLTLGVARINANKAKLSGAVGAVQYRHPATITLTAVETDGVLRVTDALGRRAIIRGQVNQAAIETVIAARPDLLVTASDSVDAGNCASGTAVYARDYARRHGLDAPPATAPIGLVWADRHDVFARRAIVQALRRQRVPIETRPMRLSAWVPSTVPCRPSSAGVGLW